MTNARILPLAARPPNGLLARTGSSGVIESSLAFLTINSKSAAFSIIGKDCHLPQENRTSKALAPLQDRFGWHPSSRLFDGTGPIADHLSARRPPPEIAVLDDCTTSLCDAMGRAQAGLGFRIGGDAGFDPSADYPMFETLTSGTSGQPRRIRRSQASWIASFQVNAGLFGIGPGARVAVLGRMVHSLSLYGALEALHLGAGLHFLADLRPDRQMAALTMAGIGLIYATPAQLRLLTEARTARALPPAPAMRHVLIGGSKLDPVTRAAVADAFPNAEIREFYGAAEASFVTLADAATPQGSVGRAYPGVNIRLQGPSSAPVPLGDAGEIWISGPYLFDGYGDDAKGNARWREGWLSVGEIGRLDAEGHLFLAGRADRMVTIADHNVFPEEIEALLLTLPGISRAAVLARPDARRGHVLDAVVMGDLPDPDSILAACRAALGPLRAPRRLLLRRDWPMLASGKTDLAALMAEVK